MEQCYIYEPTALADLCRTFQGSPWLAVDTEFLREQTYHAQLCLIQVSNGPTVACVDPLRLPNLEPLLELLYDPGVTKILHAAYQDLEILYHLRGTLPRPVFDTQTAAALLGFGNQVSYAALVKHYTGVELAKTQTRTDWSRRPLTDAQLHYAADDVRYLGTVYERQLEALRSRQRLRWLEHDFQQITDPANYRVHPEQAWLRLRGTDQFNGRQRAVARALAAWREERAVASDRPRKWILADDALLAIARTMPRSIDKLTRIRTLPDRTVQQHGEALITVIEQARQLPAEQWPAAQRRPRLSGDQDALVDALMGLVRTIGAQQEVDPATLATRKELTRLVGGDKDVPLLQGWRNEVAGRTVCEFLGGTAALGVRDDRLSIIRP